MTAAKTTKKPEKNLVLFASKYPQHIAADLAQATQDIGYRIIPAKLTSYKSGERYCELYNGQKELFVQNKAEITGANVHVLADIGTDINKFYVDTVNAIATAKEYGAKSVHVILPFAPFARQDRTFDKTMISVSGKTFPRMLKAAGADQFTAFDMHSIASEKYYTDVFGKKNVQFLSAIDLLAEQIKSTTEGKGKVQVGAPDGYDKPTDVAQRKAKQLEPLVNGREWTDYPNTFGIVKKHKGISETEATLAAGRVKGCSTVIIDDMTDTGGTLKNAAFILKAEQAAETFAALTHAIVSGDSLNQLTADTVEDKPNPIDQLIVTDSIMSIYDKVAALPEKQQKRVAVVSTVPLIKKALALKIA